MKLEEVDAILLNLVQKKHVEVKVVNGENVFCLTELGKKYVEKNVLPKLRK